MADALPATTAVPVDRGIPPRRRLRFPRLQRDERLVALIRAGDDRAFETLFSRYRPRLLAFCRGMVGSAEDAEDVLQDVFASAHRAMVADRREIRVKPWLYRIARNRCLNHLRRPTVETSEELDSEPHQNGASTADRAEKRDELRGLLEAVGDLPETQRSALLLRELEALSYEEIARTLATTVPAVKSLLVRARMSLAVASQARELSCGEVQLELAEAAEGLRKASSPARHHLRHCPHCEAYRTHLRSSARELGLLAPLGLLGIVRRLLGLKATGSGAGAGGAGTGGVGSSIGATGGIGLAGGKTIATVAVTTLLGAGASHVSGVGPPAGNRLPDVISALAPGPALVAAAPGRASKTVGLEDRTVARGRQDRAADREEPSQATRPDDTSPPADEEASTGSDDTTPTTETPYGSDPADGGSDGDDAPADDGSALSRLGFSSPEAVRHWRATRAWGPNDEANPPPPPPPPPAAGDPPDPPPPPDDGGPGSSSRGPGGET